MRGLSHESAAPLALPCQRTLGGVGVLEGTLAQVLRRLRAVGGPLKSLGRRSATPLLKSLTPERRARGKGATGELGGPGLGRRHTRFPVPPRTHLSTQGEAERRRTRSPNLGTV